MSTNVWPSNREPYHGDIVQGRLGDCFLIASLQALASCQPHLLKSIISLSPLTCFFYRQGERVQIPLLFEPSTHDYQYCRSTVTDVQWPYIIEQAYAQFYGGRYENLAGGNTSEALYDLLGKPVEEFEPNNTDIWNKIEQGLAQKKVLVTCGAVITTDVTSAMNTNGLAVNHAYAVLATFVYPKTREKYILIHNPHGTNHLLQENTQVRDAFFTMISKTHPLWIHTSGTQLLAWCELQQSCNRIQICHLDVESHQNLFGNWSVMYSGGCSNYPTFYQNPFIQLPPASLKKTTLILGHVNDQRHARTTTNVKLNYAQIGITVVRLKSHPIPTHDNYDVVCQSKFWNKREVTLTIDTEVRQGQQYAVILSTYYPNICTSFWLQFFSSQPLPSVELRTWTSAFQQPPQTTQGEWHQDNAGGRRMKSNEVTFYENPAYVLTLSSASVVRIILHQKFDADVPLAQHHPVGIYVLSKVSSAKVNEEPAFVRARSVSRLVHLSAGEEYYVIPACFEAKSFGKFEIDVLCDAPFTLDPTVRKLPLPPATTSKTTIPSTIVRKSVTTTTEKREVPKKGNISLAAARMSTLVDDYSKMK